MKHSSIYRLLFLLNGFLLAGIGATAQSQVTVTVQESIGGCGLTTNCDLGTICVDIVMSVDNIDTLDSYNIWVEYNGTIISRDTFGVNNSSPVGDNSCVIANGNADTDLEGPNFNPDHWRVAGVPGMGFPMAANTPYIVHTMCFRIKQPDLLNGQVICVGGNVATLVTSVTFINGTSDTNVPETCMTLGTDFTSCSLLPIVFLDFSAKKQEETSVLDWTTTQEVNSDYYEIQRAGENKQFLPIGKVKSKGDHSSVSAYRFVDETPLEGNNYYRIKQIDFDGRSMNSPVRSLKYDGAPIAFETWPNPTSDILHIQFQNNRINVGEIKLINLTGQVILFQTIQGRMQSTQMDVSTLEPGLYHLVIEADGVTYTDKITVIR